MTKEELSKVFVISRDIETLEERIIRLKALRERTTNEIKDVAAPTGYQLSRIEEITVQIDEREKELAELKIERACLKAELISQVDKIIDDQKCRDVIIERYGFGKRFRDIGIELHISEPHTYYLHRQGLRQLGIKGDFFG